MIPAPLLPLPLIPRNRILTQNSDLLKQPSPLQRIPLGFQKPHLDGGDTTVPTNAKTASNLDFLRHQIPLQRLPSRVQGLDPEIHHFLACGRGRIRHGDVETRRACWVDVIWLTGICENWLMLGSSASRLRRKASRLAGLGGGNRAETGWDFPVEGEVGYGGFGLGGCEVGPARVELRAVRVCCVFGGFAGGGGLFALALTAVALDVVVVLIALRQLGSIPRRIPGQQHEEDDSTGPHAKVGQLQVPTPVQEHVLRLDVPMCHALAVTPSDCVRQLDEIQMCDIFHDTFVGLDLVK
ncbi:hypothetical protein KC347_g245 [Hortaea werneckii]|nr:hypothetical protein KC347_g245 [Hortaea werneckii]